MKDIILIIEGFIIGIGKIIPGVSGAVFAMMFGVYEKALKIINNLKKELFPNFKFMFLLSVSILLAIIFGSGVIKHCLNNYYLYTMFLFIGMMVAGIKPLFNKIKGEKVRLSNVICAILIPLLLVLLDFIVVPANEGIVSKTPTTFLMLILSGFVDAVATITPGICGTALLMIIGYYNTVISSLSDIFNFSNIGNNLFVLIPFIIGMGIGIILISKLMNYLFKNHKTKTNYTIFGFAIMSTILLFVKTIKTPFNTMEILIAILLFVIGYIIVHFLDKLEK